MSKSQFQLAKSLIKDFQTNRLRAYQENEDYNLSLVSPLLNDFLQSDYFKAFNSYDIYKILGFEITENNIRDVLSSIIDPCKSEIGKNILIRLAQKFRRKKDIQVIITTPKENFSCRSEMTGELSRIDLRISTNNIHVSNIFIDFEIKVRGGSETYSRGKWQTQREWEDLEMLADEDDLKLAFYITPSATPPRCHRFYSLSWNEFIQMLNHEMENMQSSVFDPNSIAAIKHFFSSKWIF